MQTTRRLTQPDFRLCIQCDKTSHTSANCRYQYESCYKSGIKSLMAPTCPRNEITLRTIETERTVVDNSIEESLNIFQDSIRASDGKYDKKAKIACNNQLTCG